MQVKLFVCIQLIPVLFFFPLSPGRVAQLSLWMLIIFVFKCVKEDATNEILSATENDKAFRTSSFRTAHQVSLRTSHVCFLDEGQGCACLLVVISGFIYIYIYILLASRFKGIGWSTQNGIPLEFSERLNGLSDPEQPWSRLSMPSGFNAFGRSHLGYNDCRQFLFDS